MGDRSPAALRSLRIDCYWDDANTPAVSCPLVDFFGAILGRTRAFENELFCSPEGRSFVSLAPMPFRSRARITLTNESPKRVLHLYYDVNVTLEDARDAHYFHAHFRRERRTRLGHDFEVLPKIAGRGRFLGAHVGIIASEEYRGTWSGEGEVKCFLDGDRDLPTLCSAADRTSGIMDGLDAKPSNG